VTGTADGAGEGSAGATGRPHIHFLSPLPTLLHIPCHNWSTTCSAFLILVFFLVLTRAAETRRRRR
jgi:hypothetical protein